MNEKEFTDKVRQVFDRFEDPSAEHGWRELRKKYPVQHSKPMLMWWAAAAILIIAGGLWLMAPGIISDPQVGYNKPEEQIEAKQEMLEPRQETTSGNIEAATAAPNEKTPNTTAQTFDGRVNTDRSHNDTGTPVTPVDPTQPVMAARVPDAGQVPDAAVIAAARAEKSIQDKAIIALPEQQSTLAAVQPAPEFTRDSLIEAQAKLLALAQPNKPVDLHPHRVEEVKYPSPKTNTSNHAFSFFAGSFFNYSLGSETELNFGAGFTSDIKLGRNVRLSTGLAVANNSLTYNNGVPSSQKDNAQFDMPALGPSNSSLTTVTKYDANLLALDIPVNIKYLIIPEANKLYLSAGLSSGTYLSETYSVNYRNYGVSGLYLNQRQGEETKKQLQGFDFARTLNISFGYSANLGKAQNITIEPFLKYPLGGLGSENLKFGATGLNLKLNFSQFKKR